MSEYIDTRDGWREISGTESSSGQDILVLRIGGRAGRYQNRYWVREDPVPPLPTVRNTVIRVSCDGPEAGCWFLGGEFWWQIGSELELSTEDLHERIAGFEVLAEPRAAVAEQVLAQVVHGAIPSQERQIKAWIIFQRDLVNIGRQFAVTDD